MLYIITKPWRALIGKQYNMKPFTHTDHNTGKVRTIGKRKRLTLGEVRQKNARINRDKRLLGALKK